MGAALRPPALAALAGLLWVLALPPFGVWQLGPLSVLSLAEALRGAGPRRRGLLALGTGVVVFGWTLRWATIFTVPGYVVLVAVQASLLAAAAVLVPRGRGAWLAMPGAVTLLELVRHRWPLSGLPLSGLELTQVDGPLLALAGVAGPASLVLTVVLVATTVHRALVDRRTRTAVVAGLVLLAAGAVALAPLDLGTRDTGRTLQVATVQGGGTRGTPAVRSTDSSVFARHLTASGLLEPPVDLVLWPEDVVDVQEFQDSPEFAALSGLAQELDAELVVGVVADAAPGAAPAVDGVRRFRNTAVAITPAGQVEALYDKVVRVPFGEYVPWRDALSRVVDLSLIPRDAVPGRGPGLLDTTLGPLGVTISFEGLFAARARTAVQAGAELLLHPTNAASYVTPDVPSQQVASARLRAVETGRALAMAAPTGFSALVGADGRLLEHTELEQPAVLTGELPLRTGSSPYVRLGDVPAATTGMLLLIVGWAVSWQSTRPAHPPV